MRPSKAPARRTLPATQVLLALVVVGAAAFYAGYRYGLTHAGKAAPAAQAKRSSRQEPASSAKDMHFEPRSVSAASGNFLENPGFESGEAGWKWLDWSEEWAPFQIGDGHTASGSRAAHLAAHGGPGDRATRVVGVVQEIVSAKFPTRISGRYFVERWEPGAAKKAYVQVVIIAMRPKNGDPTMQLRYILDGVTEQPYQMRNARYVFVHRRTQPETGAWLDFSLDVPADYRTLLGEVPLDGTGYRVLFETRFDDKPADGTVAADVWYDDLFVGAP